ncbi:hypothetical protein HYR69_05815, partial [Candidatus Sumerlaeota bacterium]|nr:hypothetical protein [Candidatus Sumerlaeota bacterium]
MKPYLSAAAKWVFLPIVLYFSLFVILTYPLILSFSSQLFGTPVDGFSELWNLWWINKAVTQLHCSIFWSSYTYFPKGANLLGHSMSAFNGILGIPLQRLFTLLQTHNFLLVFSFVSAGWTMFLLAHYLTRCYASALLGGFCFTFSSYHFAHAWGHMNLVSLEWLPCFILAWLLLLDRPGWWTAVFAALSLFLNLMCDPLYFVYAAISALVLLLGRMWVMRDALLPIRKPHIAPFVIFAALASYSSGLFVIPLRIANTKDPFLGGHPPAVYSMDLLGPFLPCAAWRFNHWTEFFWSRLPEAGPEFNAYVGGVAFILAILGLWAEWKTPNLRTRSWGALAIVFTLLALGPVP